jgi:hypothetical protein
MMGILAQALNEDGLPGSGEIGYALPYYSFNQEDDIKYYIKNEDENYGRKTSFLMPDANGKLQWKTLTADEAIGNDSTAWYITFTPNNQYYQLRNAATGQYLTYSGGFKTIERTTLTANDNFHLMKGRVNVGSGANAKRGYWLIHPTNNWTPYCLVAKTNGTTGSATFNIANSAKAQRWLILTGDELGLFEQPNAIGNTFADDGSREAEKAIYSLDGRRLQSDMRQLKSGIYIIDGRKTIIK